MHVTLYTYPEDAVAVIRRAARADDDTPLSAAEIAEVVGAGLKLAHELEHAVRALHVTQARLHAAERSAGRQPSAGGTLELRRELGGLRYYLDGRPVHAGDRLQLLTWSGWLRGRYEWSYQERDRPTFHLGLPGAGDWQPALALPPGAELAWDDERR